ncbi:MAG: type I-U CRISPR-associated protein Cas8c [Gemmatimonadetes bacterium]|nr:type I-U CRISPR-associated protein Cas8c [Gemmatimonadota bacterium]
MREASVAESSIPVDLLNPGQVFASIGLLEAADLLLGDATGGFAWNHDGEATFRVRASGAEPPVEYVMAFLDDAEVVPIAPADSPNLDMWKDSWGSSPEVPASGTPFPFPDPSSPATLPVVLRGRMGGEIPLDYWGDATRRDNVKFWAGAAGLPGAAILRNALRIVSGKTRQHASNPFALSGAQTNSFRFDWRRDYVPIQVGFSPNRHSSIQMLGFPLVEILAAVGMSHARPNRVTKLQYEYGVLGGGESSLIDPPFHRAALGAGDNPVPGHPFRRFVMQLDWPGQEDQARCISQVREKEIDQ